MNVDHEQLIAMLTRLKLTAVRDQLDSLLDEAARRELNLREALAFLCEAEVARKDQQRIQMAMSIAHFPFVRTLEGFDFEAQPSLDPGQLRELATGRWVANGDAALLLGPPGGWHPNQYNTPIGSTFSPEQTITVVDPRHPLCGRTLPLVGIAHKPYLGRCCVVWLRPDVERLVPVSVTDLELDPRSVSRTPLCLEALQPLLEVFEEVRHGNRDIDPGGSPPDTNHLQPPHRPRHTLAGTYPRPTAARARDPRSSLPGVARNAEPQGDDPR